MFSIPGSSAHVKHKFHQCHLFQKHKFHYDYDYDSGSGEGNRPTTSTYYSGKSGGRSRVLRKMEAFKFSARKTMVLNIEFSTQDQELNSVLLTNVALANGSSLEKTIQRQLVHVINGVWNILSLRHSLLELFLHSKQHLHVKTT